MTDRRAKSFNDHIEQKSTKCRRPLSTIALDSKIYADFALHATSLCLVSRSTDISTTSSPINMNVLVVRVFFARELWLDLEGVGAEVITLGLEKVGGEVLGAVTVKPGESGRKSRGGYA